MKVNHVVYSFALENLLATIESPLHVTEIFPFWVLAMSQSEWLKILVTSRILADSKLYLLFLSFLTRPHL